jgi:hypothetical protein
VNRPNDTIAHAAAVLITAAVASACQPGVDSEAERLTSLTLIQDWMVDGHEFELVPIDQLAVSSGDDVYFTQRQDRQVRLIDSGGALAGSFGGPGEGPGEFADVSRIGLLNDTLWIFDGRRRQVSFVSREMELIRSAETPASFVAADTSGEFLAIPFESLTSDGAIYVTTHRMNADGALLDQFVTGRGIVEWDGTVRTLFMAYRRGPSERLIDEAFMIYPFTIRPLIASLADGSGTALITVSVEGPDAGTFLIERFDTRGDTVFTVRHPYEAVPLPEALANATIDSVAETWTRPVGMEQKFRENAWVPPVFPPVDDVALGRDGTTWIRLREDVSGEVSYLVLDSLGALYATAVVPASVRLVAADLDDAWGVMTDELGVQSVVKYQVTE